MNTLPEDIQDTIYKYKHQLEFEVVMWELINERRYCEWCGMNGINGFECDCEDTCVLCGLAVETLGPTRNCVCAECYPGYSDYYDSDY